MLVSASWEDMMKDVAQCLLYDKHLVRTFLLTELYYLPSMHFCLPPPPPCLGQPCRPLQGLLRSPDSDCASHSLVLLSIPPV